MGKHQSLQSQPDAIRRARMGIGTHHNKLLNRAVLTMIQLVSKVPSLSSEVQPLCSQRPSTPTALNIILPMLTVGGRWSQPTHLPSFRLSSGAENRHLICDAWRFPMSHSIRILLVSFSTACVISRVVTISVDLHTCSIFGTVFSYSHDGSSVWGNSGSNVLGTYAFILVFGK